MHRATRDEAFAERCDEWSACSSLWWATRNGWLGFIDGSNLKLQSLFGGFAREPLTEESREYVFVARRPERAAS